MTSHKVQLTEPATFAAVVAAFTAYPDRWLEPLLQLASRPSSEAGELSIARPWYRLERPAVLADGTVEIGLRWRPRDPDEATFLLFRGAFWISQQGSGAGLELRGSAYGGSDPRNDQVVADLLRYLAAALTAEADRRRERGED